MNVMYASDDSYADIAGISMISLLENNKETDDICFFMLDNGISEANRSRLSSLVDMYSRKIIFIKVPDIEKITGMKIHVGLWALAAFARLFAGSLLPPEVEKIIYLDCDTMIRASLIPFWNMDLGKNIIAGCEDGLPSIHKKTIYLKQTDIYINSGVLLIDIKTWRENDMEKKIINFLKIFNGSLRFPDQDVINSVFRNHIKLAPPKYNSISYYYEYNPELLYYADIERYYNQNQLNDAKILPIIVHFAGPGRKPWTKGNEHVHQAEYTRYINLSPWAEFNLREAKEPVTPEIKSRLPLFLYRMIKKYRSVKELSQLIREAKIKVKKSQEEFGDWYIK